MMMITITVTHMMTNPKQLKHLMGIHMMTKTRESIIMVQVDAVVTMTKNMKKKKLIVVQRKQEEILTLMPLSSTL